MKLDTYLSDWNSSLGDTEDWGYTRLGVAPEQVGAEWSPTGEKYPGAQVGGSIFREM